MPSQELGIGVEQKPQVGVWLKQQETVTYTILRELDATERKYSPVKDQLL